MSRQGHLSNPEAQKRLKDLEKVRDRMFREDLGAVLGTGPGRRLFWNIIALRCNVFGLSHTGSSQTFFNEGRRSVGIELMEAAQRLHPERYVEMLTERIRSQADDQVHQKAAIDAAHQEQEDNG